LTDRIIEKFCVGTPGGTIAALIAADDILSGRLRNLGPKIRNSFPGEINRIHNCAPFALILAQLRSVVHEPEERRQGEFVTAEMTFMLNKHVLWVETTRISC